MITNNAVIIFVLTILTACISCKDVHVRKEINCGDVSVRWYYINYFSSQRAFIDIKKGKDVINALNYSNTNVTDVICNADTVIIKIYHPSSGIIIYSSKQEAFNKMVKIDSMVSDEEHSKIYYPNVSMKP